ncbi:hypothetical protein E4T51_07176 [Aureobasidium sp. EXF-12344]|nr:hypothetical protein E4T51_07176 [Aureobasidium sp. EXF-12344]
MAPKVGDILKRFGLRGAIIRYGEQWKTQEVKDLEDDIRAFYQKYEPYLKREEEYPFEFNTDINDILERHGPVLWPDGPRSEDTTLWLFPAGEIPEYLEDIYYSRHFDKIQPLFATLLNMRVKVYRSNQRHAELKAKEKREAEAAAAAAAAANANTNDLDHALSDSDLTDFDSHDETPSLVHVIKFENDESRAKLQELSKADEFSLRKRKYKTDSPLSSVKRSKQSRVPSEPVEPSHSQHMPTWTTTNADMIRVASPFHLGNGHDLLVAAASGHTHGFVPVNRPEQNEQPVQHVSDSDEDGSVLGRTALSLHSSDGSSPNNESHPLPETPGEGFLLHTQYALPQDTAPSAQTSESSPKPSQHEQSNQEGVAPTSEMSPEATSQPQVTDKFIPWPKLNKRRAKRSKTALRPMVNAEEMEPPAQASQSLTEVPTTHPPSLQNPPPTPQQDEPFAPVDDDNIVESRKLMRRTHVRTPATESSKRTTDNTSTATPSAPQHNPQQINHLTPLSTHTQKRTYQTPYAILHPPAPTPQSVPTSADAVLGAVSSHPAPIDSPLTMSGPTPTIMNKQMPLPTTDMPVSAQIITNHFANTFVRFTLTVNGRPSHKNIKLVDCLDAVALHQKVSNRFKHGLSGQAPAEIVFIFADEEFGIDTPDESGQSLWDEFMQMIVTNAPAGTCPITAAVRV